MKRLVTLVMLLAMTGCAQTVTHQELYRLEGDRWAENVNSWWYMGTQDGYHYLQNKRLLISRNVRIKEDRLDLKRIFPLTYNEQKWVKLPMGGYSLDDPKIEQDYIKR